MTAPRIAMPDGGIPAVQEQVKRMARDSEARAMGKEINHG